MHDNIDKYRCRRYTCTAIMSTCWPISRPKLYAPGPCGLSCMPCCCCCCLCCIRQRLWLKVKLLLTHSVELNLKIRHCAIVDNVVINVYSKFDDDWLWNEKALVDRKSDNSKYPNKNNVHSAWGLVSGYKHISMSATRHVTSCIEERNDRLYGPCSRKVISKLPSTYVQFS